MRARRRSNQTTRRQCPICIPDMERGTRPRTLQARRCQGRVRSGGRRTSARGPSESEVAFLLFSAKKRRAFEDSARRLVQRQAARKSFLGVSHRNGRATFICSFEAIGHLISEFLVPLRYELLRWTTEVLRSESAIGTLCSSGASGGTSGGTSGSTSGGPPSLAGQRHVHGENVSCRVHVAVPEERLPELLLTAVAPKHSVHPCRQARLSASAQRRRMARLGLGPGARPRACGTLRLRLGRRLGALVGFLQQLVAAAADATRPELVDQSDPCPVDCCQSVPEPSLRRRSVAKPC